MYRKPLSGGLQWAVVATALVASGVALADDSSISRLTGDSYAYFNGLEYRAGQFNVEKPKVRASAQSKENSSRAADEAARKDAPMTTRDENARPATAGPSREAAPVAEPKILFASPRLVITPPVTFKDTTA